MAAAPVRVRAMALSDFLDEIIRVYRSHFVLLAGMALLIQLPTLLFSISFGSRFVTLVQSAPTARPDAEQVRAAFTDPAFLTSLAVAGLVTLIAFPFLYGAMFKASIDAVEGRPATLWSVLAAVGRRYFEVFALGLIDSLVIVLLALTCLGVPIALWIGVRWLLAGPVLFSEGAGPIQALGRSWRLTQGAWWRTFGLLLLVLLMVSVVGGGLGYIAQLLALLAPNPMVGLVVQFAVQTLLQALTQPIYFIFLALLYIDRRVRSEGAELDQLALAAAGAQPAYGFGAGSGYPPPPPGPPGAPPGPPPGSLQAPPAFPPPQWSPAPPPSAPPPPREPEQP